ncbi:hypothetical protein AAG570_011299 [Ranatra chinensis]|uniref:Uncharacterized protein n=1 Tax=Ranatra chinensis TaxID=642074 RepID=A0ABD0YK79_9HEMI
MQVIGVRRPGEKREAVADAKKSGAAKTSPPAPNGSQPVGQGAPTWMGGNLLEKAELARLEAEVEVESRELDQLREEIRRLGRAGQREEAKRQGLRARDHLALLEQSLSKERGTLSQLLSQPRALMARSRSPLPPWPFALNVPAFEVDPALLNNLKKFDTTMLNYPSKCLYKMAPPYDPYYKRPPYVTVL